MSKSLNILREELLRVEILSYKKSLINIIKSAASLMDKRLVKHGERVMFIVYYLLKLENRTKKEVSDICMLSLLHDVGAYKTEEVDKMIEFETSTPFKHSVYGYKFLEHCNVLPNILDAILYHHTNYNELVNTDCKNKDIANKIHLADRIDILLLHKDIDEVVSTIESLKGKQFSKHNVNLFIKANNEFNILQRVLDGSYKQVVNEYFSSYNLSNEKVFNYLKMVIYFIDFRSEATVSHTLTTTTISLEIAKLMRLSNKQISELAWGAMFHDIGKLAIPLNIIEKNGRLTEEEFEIMKKHSDYTREILKGNINENIVEIAARHHEKIDGSGYPLGLKGKDLSLEERIVAVADIVSALLGKRSYKEGFSKNEVLEIITSMTLDNKICKEVSNCVVKNYDDIILKSFKKSNEAIIEYNNFNEEANLLLNKLGLTG